MAVRMLKAGARPHFDRLKHSGVQRLRILALCTLIVVILVHAHALPKTFLGGSGMQTGALPRAPRSSRMSVAAGSSDEGRDAREANKWRLNVGHVLDVLRRDVPHTFDRSYDLDYSIFSPNVVAEDARLPSFQMKGLQAYRTAIDLMRQVVRTTCDYHKLEIQSISFPVNSVVYVRWRMQIWPKDPLGPAKDFLNPAWRLSNLPLYGYGAAVEPSILEGYSRYEFDVWSGEVTKHAIEIKLPPMLLKDVIPSFAFSTRSMQAVPF
mmetsp:Transcript_24269/g.45894  ORF Transcript_24269/g.45894 Transcript_24269/m.45894 type:complete len:265 (+) Transcript_24269:57-851(+)